MELDEPWAGAERSSSGQKIKIEEVDAAPPSMSEWKPLKIPQDEDEEDTTKEDPIETEAKQSLENIADPKPLSSTIEKSTSPSQNAASTTESPLSQRIQDLTNKALQFLSTASNETMGAILVGLCGTTYLALGRVGLVLIGVVGGVALHASWDGSHGSAQDVEIKVLETRRRKELGLEITKRILLWRNEENEKSAVGNNGLADAADLAMLSQQQLDYSDFQPETAKALTELTDAVVRDYVKWWYDPIRPSENTFPSACRQTLTRFMISVSTHLSHKRPADTFLDFVTNSSSMVIVFLNELSAALMASSAAGLSTAEAIEDYLVREPESSLVNVLSAAQQKKKLNLVAEDLLQTFLDAKSYNCEPAHIFLREILAGVILDMTINSCSKPEFINGWIIYLLEDPEPGIMEAIDAGIEGTDKQFDEAKAKAEAAQKHKEEEALKLLEVKASADADAAEEELQKKRLSKAEDAMEEAMLEAKRLTEMILKEEEAAQKAKEAQEAQEAKANRLSESVDTLSTVMTTDGMATPTSSDGDPNTQKDVTSSPTQAMEVPNPISVPTTTSAPFTNFDQLAGPESQQSTSPLPSPSAESAPVLTLHKATVNIFDDSMPGEKGTMRSKPTGDLMLQIEPASSRFPGWMIPRKYADFETLHEVLRRIANISGVPEFTAQHATLPTWKGQSKQYLSQNLELYLQHALNYESLAESEGMRRFLEKDRGLGKKSSGFGFPSPAAFENVGKGMLDVLTSTPKGVAGGGKAVFDGVAGGGKAIFQGVGGVFGGQRKPSSSSSTPKSKSVASTSTPVMERSSSVSSMSSSIGKPRESADASRLSTAIDRKTSIDTTTVISTVPEDSEELPPLPARPAARPSMQEEPRPSTSGTNISSLRDVPSSEADVPARTSLSGSRTSLAVNREELHLPPPPSDIPDDYTEPSETAARRASLLERGSIDSSIPAIPSTPARNPRTSVKGSPSKASPSKFSPSKSPSKPKAATQSKSHAPLTIQETRITIELMFVLINELYSLSSAWNIRKTLLNAAKSYLLRAAPGSANQSNPSLDAIHTLLQETILEANTTDAGLATHILKIRQNAMPTPDELAAWPAPLEGEALEAQRVKARKILVEKGMPAALTSVMGAAASGEALGRVFDALQEEKVARGFMFAVMLQGVRALTQ